MCRIPYGPCATPRGAHSKRVANLQQRSVFLYLNMASEQMKAGRVAMFFHFVTHESKRIETIFIRDVVAESLNIDHLSGDISMRDQDIV